MSEQHPSTTGTIKLYATAPHRCSYIPGNAATTLFVDPFYPMDTGVYSYLSRLGFRRSGNHIYRPECPGCDACIPARIPVRRFEPDRSQRRTWEHNRDLEVRCLPGIQPDRHYALYERYITLRHQDGDMFPPDRDQFENFLGCEWSETYSYEFNLGDRPVAVAIVDRLNDGLSAIYTFFDPDEERRSLGTLAVLWQVQEARRMGLPWVYLGYWIPSCRKMSYKGRYQPLEILRDGSWTPAEKRL